MKAILTLLAIGFQSSSGKTPEFKSFARKFKNALVQQLDIAKCKITAYNVGHFYISGFFRSEDGMCYYFSLSDVRAGKETKMYWRTAKDEKDFTGGHNRFITINDEIGKLIRDQIYMDKEKVSFLITD